MQNATTIAGNSATLSESELFRRYLDAPVRVGATASTLIADPGKMPDVTAREWLLQHGHSSFMPLDYAEAILDLIENDDDPIAELDQVIDDLSELANVFKVMKRDFARLAEVTRTQVPDEGTLAEVYRNWRENPRYVLPVIEPKEAA